MRKNLLGIAIMSSLAISLASCNGVDKQANPEPATANIENAEQHEQTNTPFPMNRNGQIAFAKQDLAQRMNIPVESVVLSSAKSVRWRSGALGCPKPGVSYTEALVPGTVIYLLADNMIHAYHARFAGEPFYCPRERAETPATEGDGDMT
jgi:hypothetical protein